VLLSKLIAIFRLLILISFVVSFLNFTFLDGSFQITMVNMVFSLGLLLVVRDPASDLLKSFVMLLESDDMND